MNIVVLGSHRCGTSMVAGVIEKLGYHVGHDDELIGKGIENPKGFFERRDVRKINDEILHVNGYDWYKIAHFSIESLSEDSRDIYKKSLAGVFNQLDSRGKWLIKEPRLCLLYPLFKQQVSAAIKLLVFRDPVECADSLWRRNGFPMNFGLTIWEEYYRKVLAELDDDKVIFVNYNKLVDNPEEEVTRLLDEISAMSGEPLSGEEREAAISFVSTDLRRSTSYNDYRHFLLSDGQRRLYDRLLDNMTGKAGGEKCEGCNDIVLEQYQEIFEKVTILKSNEKSLKRERDDLVKSNAACNEQVRRAEEKLDIKKDELEKCVNLSIRRKAEIDTLKTSMSWKMTRPLRYLTARFPGASSFVTTMLRGGNKIIKQLKMRLRQRYEKTDWGPSPGLAARIKSYRKQHRRTDTKVAVCTAVFGAYDTLMVHDVLDANMDYICFSDAPQDTYGVWQMKSTPYYHPDSTRMARYVKLHLHELLNGYDHLVWLDSNILARCDLKKYINKLVDSKCDIGFVLHPHRECFFDEAEACKRLGKDDPQIIDKQVAEYQKRGYPLDAGMYETGFYVVSLANSHIKKFFRIWWSEIDQFSKRDQLSVGWAISESGVNVIPLLPEDITVRNTPDFSIFTHEQSRFMTVPGNLRGFRKVCEPSLSLRQGGHDLPEVAPTASIDIIVCVYNALEDVMKCLESVVKSLESGQRVIIVNDKSDDATTSWLEAFSTKYASVSLINNATNLGYTRSANTGLQASSADFRIMLNSDTIVSPRWASKLAEVAYSCETIGIVGPLSNAAGSQSIPDIRGTKSQTAINELPDNVSYEDVDRECEKWSSASLFPRVPLVHGFCFAIKKEVIESIGFFDDENFERYYGEENDYCFRARAAGFEFAIATNIFVYHRKSRSIEEEERIIHMKSAGQRLRDLYGVDNVILACRQLEDHPLLVRMRELSSSYFYPNKPGLAGRVDRYLAGIRSIIRR